MPQKLIEKLNKYNSEKKRVEEISLSFEKAINSIKGLKKKIIKFSYIVLGAKVIETSPTSATIDVILFTKERNYLFSMFIKRENQGENKAKKTRERIKKSGLPLCFLEIEGQEDLEFLLKEILVIRNLK